MPDLVEIVQARIVKSDAGNIRPERVVKEILSGPGWSSAVAPSAEGVIAIALAKAKKLDIGRGITFIQNFMEDPHQSNGP